MQKEAQKVTPKKRTKVPTVLLAMAHISEDIKNEVIETLEEGLSHLNINILMDETSELALEKSHVVVLFGKDENLLKKAWKEGVVPITQAFDGSIVDYNPNTESGNAFIYENANHWEVFAAIVRACETYKFPYDWKFIVRSCTKSAKS
jgi:hypothetical protein